MLQYFAQIQCTPFKMQAYPEGHAKELLTEKNAMTCETDTRQAGEFNFASFCEAGWHLVGIAHFQNLAVLQYRNEQLFIQVPAKTFMGFCLKGPIEEQELGILFESSAWSLSHRLVDKSTYETVRAEQQLQRSKHNLPIVGSTVTIDGSKNYVFVGHLPSGSYQGKMNFILMDTINGKLENFDDSIVFKVENESVNEDLLPLIHVIQQHAILSHQYYSQVSQVEYSFMPIHYGNPLALLQESVLAGYFKEAKQLRIDSQLVLANPDKVAGASGHTYSFRWKLFKRQDGKFTIQSSDNFSITPVQGEPFELKKVYDHLSEALEDLCFFFSHYHVNTCHPNLTAYACYIRTR